MKFKPNTFVTHTTYNRECIVVRKSETAKGTYLVKVIATGEIVVVHKSELTKVDNQAGALVRALNSEEAWGLTWTVYLYDNKVVTRFREVGGSVEVQTREGTIEFTVEEAFEAIERYTYETNLI